MSMKFDFFEIMGCLVDYHGYVSRTKATANFNCSLFMVK